MAAAAAADGAPRVHDVVVVGAGLSGLCAAERALAGGARGVLLLEAADRVGGRTCAARLACCPSATVDAGGQWLGTRHAEALALAARYGLARQPQYVTGRKLLQVGPVVAAYTGHIPRLSVGQLVDTQLALWGVRALQVALWLLPAAWAAHRALARWADATTVAALCDAWMWTPGGRALLRIVVQALTGCEPRDVSVLALARYVAGSGGSLEEMTDMGPGSVQAWTLAGGAAQLSGRLAADVVAAGAVIACNTRVVGLTRRRDDGGGGGYLVDVRTADGALVTARHVVLALPPPLAAPLAFDPPLPRHRAGLLTGSGMGAIIKMHLVYTTAFWRAAGYSGECVCDVTTDPSGGPAFNVFDGCIPVPADAVAYLVDMETGAPAATPAEVEWLPPTPADTAAGLGNRKYLPCLVAFLNADAGRAWSGVPPAARRDAVLAQLARWFGPPALAPLEVRDKDWGADPFTRGCPIATYGAGVLGRYGLARDLGAPCWSDVDDGTRGGGGEGSARSCRLHWAATETSPVSPGFMDGAIRAGRRAGDEVLAGLGPAGGGGSGSGSKEPPAAAAATAPPLDGGSASPQRLQEPLLTEA
jgi:monoamine oxidase